jgi:hypothetical protein
MRENNRCTETWGELPVEYVEATVGQDKYANEPQSAKPCEKCLFFNRDLITDEPCGLCYESADKPNWEKSNGDAESGEMECSDYRVCEACPSEG